MADPNSIPPSRTISPRPLKWHGKLAAFAAYNAIRAMPWTLRMKCEDASGLATCPNGKPALFAIWHNRLALALLAYRYYVQPPTPTRRLAAIVSASRDGGLVARVLDLFGVTPVRGSSSRRGAQALLEMTTLAEEGLDLAITPDGPRGPCYEVQDGVIALAQLTGLPIIPVSLHLGWKIELKSWDRFQIPIPFSTCTFYFGKPIAVARDATTEERELIRLELEKGLMAITRD